MMAKSQMISEWLTGFKQSLRSRKDFYKFIETKESVSSTAQQRNVWSNGMSIILCGIPSSLIPKLADLDISPREDWTWTWWDYAAFWWSYGFSVGVWSLGSSMISLGLNWWQGILS